MTIESILEAGEIQWQQFLKTSAYTDEIFIHCPHFIVTICKFLPFTHGVEYLKRPFMGIQCY